MLQFNKELRKYGVQSPKPEVHWSETLKDERQKVKSGLKYRRNEICNTASYEKAIILESLNKCFEKELYNYHYSHRAFTDRDHCHPGFLDKEYGRGTAKTD
jgi:hypothetical protein